MPSPEYIGSFLENNSGMLDILQQSIDDGADTANQLRIVYHSVPLSCLLDKVYQSEIIAKLAG